MKKIDLSKLIKEFLKLNFVKETSSYIKTVKQSLTVKKAVIIGFALFCIYIIYLSIPSFYSKASTGSIIEQQINKIFKSDSVKFEKLSYSIFPKPHFYITNVSIYQGQDYELAGIKKINIFISQKNFFKKNLLNVKLIQIINANFYLNYKNFINIKQYIKKGKSQRVQIKKSNIFLLDQKHSNIAISNINKINLKFNKNKNTNEFSFNGEIYKLPFKLNYIVDLSKKENDLFLNFKKINLLFKNNSKNHQPDTYTSEIKFLKTKFNSLIQYDKNTEAYKINSIDSKIHRTEIDYTGNINTNPFYFNFEFNIEDINYKNLFFLNNFIEKVIYNYLTNNEYINGNLEINIKKIKKQNIFTKSNIRLIINRGEIDFSETKFELGDIGKMEILSNKIYSDNNGKIILITDLIITINDQKKLYKKFLIPKKNRKKIKNIYLTAKLIPSSREIILSNFSFEEKKIKSYDKKEELITSWQDFRLLVNDLFKNYEG